MPIKVKVEVSCEQWGCEAKIETVATLEGRIVEGGKVDLSLDPDLPDEWAGPRYWEGIRCPKHH